MSISLKIDLNPNIYLKDPQDSALGRKIIEHGIELIYSLGFESFTFKKLAERIESTEASIYRYFENKHMLLTYLMAWYWEWVNYLISVNLTNLEDPQRKLKVIIKSFLTASEQNPLVDYVDESKLNEIVIAEGSKVYHTKDVDNQNSKGYFKNYKDLISLVSRVISEVDPTFKYPQVLASNLFEMSNTQIHFAKHLPRLTDIKTEGQDFEEVELMLNYFVEKLLSSPANNSSLR